MVNIPSVGITGIIEISVIAMVIYYAIKSMRNTRAWILLKGLFVLLLMYTISYFLNFEVIVQLFKSTIIFIGIAVIIVLEPEIRNFIENIGINNIVTVKKLISRDKGDIEGKQKLLDDKVIIELVDACIKMGAVKTGALIVIEDKIPLDEYIATGISLNADISSQLLLNIFEKNTPLHDGAIVIRGNKVIAGTCYLPLSSNRGIGKELGTRHRAAIGVSEVTDSVVITVSEETGAIGIAYKGELEHGLTKMQLTERLRELHKEDKSNERIEPAYKLKDIPLKMMVFIGSVLLWIAVISAVDPIETKVYRGIEVEKINTDVIADVGKTYRVKSGDRVNVTLKDRKSTLDSIDISDIKVTADFKKLSIVNAIELGVNIEKSNRADISLSDTVMEVGIEDLVSHEYMIEVDTIGDVDSNHYIAGISLSEPNIVVTGAKSIMDTIGKIAVEVNVDGIMSGREYEIEPKIYDKNGKLFNRADYELNNNKVKVKIDLYNTRLIPIKLNYTVPNKELASIIEKVSLEEPRVRIASTDNKLKGLEGIDVGLEIGLNMGEVDKREYIKNVDIRQYLPEGYYVDDRNSRVNVVISFKDIKMSSIEYSASDIEIRGKDRENKEELGDGIELDDRVYKLTLIGEVGIRKEELNLYIDGNKDKRVFEIQIGNDRIADKIKDGSIKLYGDTKVVVKNKPSE